MAGLTVLFCYLLINLDCNESVQGVKNTLDGYFKDLFVP